LKKGKWSKNDEKYEGNVGQRLLYNWDAYCIDNACNMDSFSTQYLRNYLILDSDVNAFKLVAVRSIRAKPDHPCHKQNGGCSHICAAVQKHKVSNRNFNLYISLVTEQVECFKWQ
jgi:hypothetical protein